MHRASPLLAASLLLLAVSPLWAQRPTSVDPTLRALLRPEVRARLGRMPRPAQRDTSRPGSAFGDVAVTTGPTTAAPRVGIFVRLRDPAGEDAIRAAGGDILASAGSIVAATVPVDELPDLIGSGAFERVEAARKVRAVDDSSIVAIHGDSVREQAQGRWVGFDGAGVLVGVYDTGIDFRHDDFLDPAGNTRLLGLWDQTLTAGPPPSGFSFGRYCSPADIQATVQSAASPGCPERDFAGHGTHVAGIAAGDGSAGNTDYRYAGVAPAAGLLVVKGGDSSFSEDTIAAGLQWLKQEAQALGRPIAVNLSLGSSYGPHDGTRLYEQMIDSLSGPGYIVSVAAGNDGDNGNSPNTSDLALIHARTIPQSGSPHEMDVSVPTYTPSGQFCADYAVFDAWYDGADSLVLTVTRPDGSSVTAATRDSVVQDVASGGLIYVDNASTGVDPVNGDHEAYIELSNCASGAGAPQAGTWKIQVTPVSGTTPSGQPYDMWLFASQLGTSDFATGTLGFDNRSTVDSPGTADRALTVGSFVTRYCFPSSSGTACTSAEYREPPGDISAFSGTGPTRDGRLKPDIAAPGSLVISSRSEAATFPSILITADARHVALQGTSMATPHLTGTLALWLQLDSLLTPEDARALLTRTALHTPITQNSYVAGDPGGTPNYDWGWGKVDVKAGLVDLGATNGASTLSVDVTKITPPASPSSAAGTRIPFLELRLASSGPEAEDVYQLAFHVTGADAGADVVLVDDQNANGVMDTGEPVVAQATVSGTGASDVFVAPQSPIVVPAGGSTQLVAAVEMSGNAPNGSLLQLTYLPSGLRSAGARTDVVWLRTQPGSAVASSAARTTVLEGGAVFGMSENPIRSDRVYFNFSSMPDLAAIYTLTGRRVVDLRQRIDNGYRAVWDVTNDENVHLAPGVYLLVVDVAGQRVTKKLIITGESVGGSEDR